MRTLALVVVLALAIPPAAAVDARYDPGSETCASSQDGHDSETSDGTDWHATWWIASSESCSATGPSATVRDGDDEVAHLSTGASSSERSYHESGEAHGTRCVDDGDGVVCENATWTGSGSRSESSTEHRGLRGHAAGVPVDVATRACERSADGSFAYDGGGSSEEWAYEERSDWSSTSDCRAGAAVGDARVVHDDCHEASTHTDSFTYTDDGAGTVDEQRSSSSSTKTCESRAEAAGQEISPVGSRCERERTSETVLTYDTKVGLYRNSTEEERCFRGLDEDRDVDGLGDVGATAGASTRTSTVCHGPCAREAGAGLVLRAEAAGASTGRHEVGVP